MIKGREQEIMNRSGEQWQIARWKKYCLMSILNKTADKNIDTEVSKWFTGRDRRDTPEATDCFEGWWTPAKGQTPFYQLTKCTNFSDNKKLTNIILGYLNYICIHQIVSWTIKWTIKKRSHFDITQRLYNHSHYILWKDLYVILLIKYANITRYNKTK